MTVKSIEKYWYPVSVILIQDFVLPACELTHLIIV